MIHAVGTRVARHWCLKHGQKLKCLHSSEGKHHLHPYTNPKVKGRGWGGRVHAALIQLRLSIGPKKAAAAFAFVLAVWLV